MTKPIQDYLNQATPQHTGDIIKAAVMAVHDLNEPELAKQLKVNKSTINRLLKKEITLSPEMAIKLSAVLGGEAGQWLAMQARYDVIIAAQKMDMSEYTPFEQAA